MQAIYNSVYRFLGTDQQFVIPIFQRKYDWDKKQCKDLFDDIIMIGQSSDDSHFLGSIVHLDDAFNVIPTYRVIDGQQRLTTLTLLLCALAKFLRENTVEDLEITSEKLINKYIINRDEEGDLKYRIKLNSPDNETLQYIIDDTMSEGTYISPPKESKTIRENYKYFFNRIKKDNAKILYDGFLKLHLIIIKLDEHSDNSQLIFESLNYKGRPLNNSDLIRNYVLMGLKPHEQDTIYRNYWDEIEQKLKETDGYTFDKFIKDYLTTKQGKIPVEKDLYDEFKLYTKEFFRENSSTNMFDNIKTLTKDIYKYFKYFEKFYIGEEEDNDLRLAFKNVYQLGQRVITPFFLHLYNDYANNLIEQPELLKIVNLTEIYLFRRNTCGLSNQGLKTIYARAYDELNKNRYFDDYQALLLNEEGERRFPKNEFGVNFIKKDFYKNRAIAKYTLGKLENFGHEKEPTNIDSLTIEHILPQKEELSEEWQKELGSDWKQIQEKYLHTIGNLTLTGYNEKLSHLPFKTKRDMDNGFADSSIRLNKSLAKLDTWNEIQIEKRAADLRKRANKIWPYPKVQKHLK